MAESINNTVKGKNVACNKRSVVIHGDEAIRMSASTRHGSPALIFAFGAKRRLQKRRLFPRMKTEASLRVIGREWTKVN